MINIDLKDIEIMPLGISDGSSSGGGDSSDVEINNQTKEITITENGTQTITYDDGYTGLEIVNIIVDVTSDDSQQSISNANMGFDILPTDLVKCYNTDGYYFWDYNDNCLYYPNGDFILRESWNVQKFEGDGNWSDCYDNNSNQWSTVFPSNWIEFDSLKRKYKILCGKWSNDESKNIYYTPEQLYNMTDEQNYYNLNDGTCYNFYGEEINYKYSDKDFNFYYLNDSGEYECYNHYLPNGNEAVFYPLFEKIGYCKNYNSDSFNDGVTEFIGVNVVVQSSNSFEGEHIITFNIDGKQIKAEYINFVDSYSGEIVSKLQLDYFGYYGSIFPYLTSVHRIERITYPTYQSNVGLNSNMIANTELYYIGEITFEENLTSFRLINTNTNVEYCLLKNIGICENMTAFQCNSYYWGINDKYTNSHQAALDSLITYSFDRATNGYSALNIILHSQFVESLTDTEIAEITAKGFTITT